jgi:hypothetical protein
VKVVAPKEALMLLLLLPQSQQGMTVVAFQNSPSLRRTSVHGFDMGAQCLKRHMLSDNNSMSADIRLLVEIASKNSKRLLQMHCLNHSMILI